MRKFLFFLGNWLPLPCTSFFIGAILLNNPNRYESHHLQCSVFFLASISPLDLQRCTFSTTLPLFTEQGCHARIAISPTAHAQFPPFPPTVAVKSLLHLTRIFPFPPINFRFSPINFCLRLAINIILGPLSIYEGVGDCMVTKMAFGLVI